MARKPSGKPSKGGRAKRLPPSLDPVVYVEDILLVGTPNEIRERLGEMGSYLLSGIDLLPCEKRFLGAALCGIAIGVEPELALRIKGKSGVGHQENSRLLQWLDYFEEQDLRGDAALLQIARIRLSERGREPSEQEIHDEKRKLAARLARMKVPRPEE